MTEYLERDDGSKMPVGKFLSATEAAKRRLNQAKQRYKADPTSDNRDAVVRASERYEKALLEEARGG